jgi:single-stranded DNA-binding protein
MSANHTILSGVVKNSNTKTVGGGLRITSLHINNKSDYYDKEGYKRDLFCLVDCELWNKISDEFQKLQIKDGDIIQVYGSLKTSFYGSEDNKKKKTCINVVGFLLIKKNVNFQEKQNDEQDDLPF